MSSEAFPYSEAKVCDRMGIPRTVVKGARDRDLQVDRDWKKNGGEIAFSSSGVKRLWRVLTVRPPAFDLAQCLISTPQKKNAATEILVGCASMPIPVVMKVTRVCLNPGIVQAQATTGLDRRTVNVWVGRNEHFAVGMEIQTVPKKHTSEVWVMAGPMPLRSVSAMQWNRMQQANGKKG